MARALARRSFARTTRRLTEWGISMQTNALVNVPANSKVLVVSTAGGLLEPFTIIRTRGYLTVVSDQQASTEFQLGAFGLGVVTSRARAAGIASIPGAFTDAIWDGWFVHQSFGNKFTFSDATGIQAITGVQHEIDSKAMRRVDGADEDIVFVVENPHATQAFGVMFQVRILIKEN